MYVKKFTRFCQGLKRYTEKKIGSFFLPHGVVDCFPLLVRRVVSSFTRVCWPTSTCRRPGCLKYLAVWPAPRATLSCVVTTSALCHASRSSSVRLPASSSWTITTSAPSTTRPVLSVLRIICDVVFTDKEWSKKFGKWTHHRWVYFKRGVQPNCGVQQ